VPYFALHRKRKPSQIGGKLQKSAEIPAILKQSCESTIVLFFGQGEWNLRMIRPIGERSALTCAGWNGFLALQH